MYLLKSKIRLRLLKYKKKKVIFKGDILYCNGD